MNVTLAWHACLAAADGEMYAFARSKGAETRDLYPGGARNCLQRRAFARRNGDHQLVIVAAAQHICPERRIGFDRTPRRCRKRHALTLDVRAKPRSLGDMSRIGQQTV